MWWAVWLVLAASAASGLPRLHINNSLRAWSPEQTPSDAIATYVVIGFESGRVDPAFLEHSLRELPSVAWCFGPASEALLRIGGIGPEGLVTSIDRSYSGIYCFARPGIEPSTFCAEISRVLSDVPGAGNDGFALSGSAVFSTSLNDVSQQRMPLIMAIITVIGGAMLWLLTGSLRAAASGLAAISLSMLVLLGGASWAGVDFDMSLLLVPPLMISLGYSYAAHAALRRDAAPALAICGVTSILGVAAFGTTDLPSIRSFALWGSLGVALVWLCVMSLVPTPAAPRPHDFVDRCAQWWLLRRLRRNRVAIVGTGVLVSIAGVWLAPSLVIDAQPLNYFQPSARIVRDNAVLERRLTGMLPFEVIAPRTTDVLPQLMTEPAIRKAIAVPLPKWRSEQVIWCLANNDSLESLNDVFQRWERDSPWADHLSLRGVAPQLLEVRRQMRRVAALSIPSMLAVAALATGLLARSLRAALAGFLVNLIPVAAIIVIGVAFRWPTQMPTLMVGAIGIGAGIDDAVHVVWLRRRHSVARSLHICLRACAGSSAVAALCMAAFAISPFGPTAQFGLLMALILTLAAIADMVVLPALLLRIHAHHANSAPCSSG